MKCRICARECPPGAKICRDCAAARKRAFAATVTEPLLAAVGAPTVGRPRFAPQPAKPRTPRRAAAAVSPRSEAPVAASAASRKAAPARLDVKWLLLGLAVAAAIVYLLLRELAPTHGYATNDAAASGESAPAIAPSNLAPTTPTPTVAAEPRDAAARGAPQPGAVVRPDLKGDSDVAPKDATPKVGVRKAAAKVEAVKIPPPPPVTPPQAEPVPAPPPPPRVAEAPRDPWQVMNEGLSRCAREDWLSRGVCEQRLRLQYCANYWGLVAQCPIGPATDHGQ
jgi:hypothetical protein